MFSRLLDRADLLAVWEAGLELAFTGNPFASQNIHPPTFRLSAKASEADPSHYSPERKAVTSEDALGSAAFAEHMRTEHFGAGWGSFIGCCPK